jgi:hypothetical protein
VSSVTARGKDAATGIAAATGAASAARRARMRKKSVASSRAHGAKESRHDGTPCGTESAAGRGAGSGTSASARLSMRCGCHADVSSPDGALLSIDGRVERTSQEMYGALLTSRKGAQSGDASGRQPDDQTDPNENRQSGGPLWHMRARWVGHAPPPGGK